MSQRKSLMEWLPPNAGPTLEWLNAATVWALQHITYLHDHENPEVGKVVEHWRTMLPRIIRRLNGDESGPIPVPDDCDGFTMTLADIAIAGGFAKEDCRMLIVNTWFGRMAGKPYDHLIFAVRINGEWWIAGDTADKREPYPASICPHDLYAAHTFPINENNFHKVSSWDEV